MVTGSSSKTGAIIYKVENSVSILRSIFFWGGGPETSLHFVACSFSWFDAM